MTPYKMVFCRSIRHQGWELEFTQPSDKMALDYASKRATDFPGEHNFWVYNLETHKMIGELKSRTSVDFIEWMERANASR